jgi:processive 1,2-diacylglycerol beta-glucosyltransferase
MSGPRVLVLSASIGAGHDLPAEVLAAELRERAPGAHVAIADSLEAAGPLVRTLVLSGASFESRWGNLVFDVEYWLITHAAPVRRGASWLAEALARRGLERLIARERPDVIVSTYPGATEVLGRMRRRGRLRVPLVSAITDLAALRYWSHPGVDLHLVTHPESAEEVREIAGAGTEALPVRGLNDPAYAEPLSRPDARRALELPAEVPLVVVSGGGWGVGDLEGAVEEVLAIDAAQAVVLCGTNDELQARLGARFAAEGERVRVWGFTTRMPQLLAAADALVHSTAGLTVLEAIVRGCPAISFGWGRGHIRANNRAFVRFGLADVAPDRVALAGALRRALAARHEPDPSFPALPTAAAVVLDRFGRVGGGDDLTDQG